MMHEQVRMREQARTRQQVRMCDVNRCGCVSRCEYMDTGDTGQALTACSFRFNYRLFTNS